LAGALKLVIKTFWRRFFIAHYRAFAVAEFARYERTHLNFF
jgi:hypothetical protein